MGNCNPVNDPQQNNPQTSSGTDGAAIHDNVASEISAIAEKTTPVDADLFIIEDSAAANAKKKLSWSNIKATLKTYFDAIYAAITHASTHENGGGDEINVAGLSGELADAQTPKAHNQAESTLSFTDIVTGNFSITAHGFVPKGTNTGKFLKDDGSWGTPAGGGATFWTTWAGAARTDDNTITSTAILTVGTPIRYKATGGTYRYGIVSALAANVHSIMGSPCTIADDDVFEYGDISRMESKVVHFSGNFNDANSDTLFASDLNMKEGWRPAIANEYYCVGFFTICGTADGTADPDVNLVVAGGVNKLFTNDINVDETTDNTAVTVANAVNTYYALTFASLLECSVDISTGAGDAYDMDLVVIFVKV